jgi:hypothetical protein
MGTPVIVDHRLLLDQFNGIYRTVAHAIPATNAFFRLNFHKANKIGAFTRINRLGCYYRVGGQLSVVRSR